MSNVSADLGQKDTAADYAVSSNEADNVDRTKTLDTKLPRSLWGDLPIASAEKDHTRSCTINLCILFVLVHILSYLHTDLCTPYP
jgi:hypothetical protein